MATGHEHQSEQGGEENTFLILCALLPQGRKTLLTGSYHYKVSCTIMTLLLTAQLYSTGDTDTHHAGNQYF